MSVREEIAGEVIAGLQETGLIRAAVVGSVTEKREKYLYLES